MTVADLFQDLASAWWPAAAVVAMSVLILWGVRRYLTWRFKATPMAAGFLSPLVMLALTGVALVALTVVMPLGDTIRGQLLGLLGLLVTAAIALASTTFVGNAMAGMMLRSIRNMRPGDFVRVGEHFGRVSDQGLLHTEIQTEDRDLTTLPNLHLVTQPVTVIRSSGTILSATISLGYDISRSRVQECLLQAAADAGLKEPFVQITDLGDFSIEYRIAGMLEDVKHLLSSRSELRTCMLDRLHGAGIEIVSPTFMNQRILPAGRRIGSEPERSRSRVIDESPEQLIFDKAEAAEARAELEDTIKATTERIAALDDQLGGADPQARADLEVELEQQQAKLEKLQRALAEAHRKS